MIYTIKIEKDIDVSTAEIMALTPETRRWPELWELMMLAIENGSAVLKVGNQQEPEIKQ